MSSVQELSEALDEASLLRNGSASKHSLPEQRSVYDITYEFSFETIKNCQTWFSHAGNSYVALNQLQGKLVTILGETAQSPMGKYVSYPSFLQRKLYIEGYAYIGVP